MATKNGGTRRKQAGGKRGRRWEERRNEQRQKAFISDRCRSPGFFGLTARAAARRPQAKAGAGASGCWQVVQRRQQAVAGWRLEIVDVSAQLHPTARGVPLQQVVLRRCWPRRRRPRQLRRHQLQVVQRRRWPRRCCPRLPTPPLEASVPFPGSTRTPAGVPCGRLPPATEGRHRQPRAVMLVGRCGQLEHRRCVVCCLRPRVP